MGIIRAIGQSIGGSLADQWKDIITAEEFDEYSVVVPGIQKKKSSKRGSNVKGSDNLLSNGSKIYVPENTVAFVFTNSGIENIIDKPGVYEYQDGEDSIFNGDGATKLFKQIGSRITTGGISSVEHRIAYVNLREIRNIRFGTRGPQVYHDKFYDVDLEIYAYGSFTIKVIDPMIFVKNFVPANVSEYSFASPEVRSQIISEFLQSFIVVLNNMSNDYRISQLPSCANVISQYLSEDMFNAGSWNERFGFEVAKVAVEHIEFSDESRQLINEYSSKKLDISAYENVSQKSADIAAQQKIASGVKEHGLGDGGGMVFGMNMAQKMTTQDFGNTAARSSKLSIDEQIEALKKLKELVDAGILTDAEFETKKKEIMGI